MTAVACKHCHVLTHPDCLEDISDIVALAGRCCELCAAEIVYEAHAELDEYDVCMCGHCYRHRVEADRLRRAAEARAFGGVSMAGLRLVGLDGGEDV